MAVADLPGDAIAEVYTAAFAEPPYSQQRDKTERAMALLPTIAVQPGARAVLARMDGELVGGAWGWRTPPGLCAEDGPYPRRLYDGIGVALGGADAAERLLVGRFEVSSLFVHPDHQGAGIGRALLTHLVDGTSAWLLSWLASAALPAYRRWGWRERVKFTSGEADVALLTIEEVPG
ncbi:acetyltransferase (GNAT) family protein [Herbihabitans rhizosphaerae]|uniref:Acetyltransferase (GNAT) family protein n=1 Tax=Herbihabitans rhizosphaerae TaxID=1872711 RepID=A0A4Q7KJF3_9PSEU|nr:GNAT family N-acetyltransferase [Herbihabitans rhizosphaerae]RZS34744.1 acetyltransferase (GNAT) family protein [Herbihabitans rhizosphaerae]